MLYIHGSAQDRATQIYWLKKETRDFNVLTFCVTQQWDTGKLPPLQKVQFIFFILIVYALDHTGSAKHGLRKLREMDSEWIIFTCGV